MRKAVWKMLAKLGLALGLMAMGGAALAADRCPTLRHQQSDPSVATRIAAIACDEHIRWNRPFIDPEGRIASFTSHEAESRGLADGGAPWRRVARYWQDTGLLGQVAQRQETRGDDCIDYTVDVQSSSVTASGLMSGADDRTQVWIPDSSLWAERVTSAAPSTKLDMGPVVATSPVVFAIPRGAAGTALTAASGTFQ